MLAADGESGEHDVPLTGERCVDDLCVVAAALGKLDAGEVGFHRAADRGQAIPVHGDHAKLGRGHRGRWDAARHGVGFDHDHEHSGPFAELIRVFRDGADAHLDLRAAVQVAEAEPRGVGRASRIPWRAIDVPSPFGAVSADLDALAVRGLRDLCPRYRGQSSRMPIGIEVCRGLHDEPLRRLRHPVVAVGGRGLAAFAAGQCGSACDALDLLRLAYGSVVPDIVQCEAGGQPLALAHAQVDFLHAHLLTMGDGRSCNPIAGMIVDERQTVHVGNDEIACVLASHSRRIIQSGLHECLGGALVTHATLRAVGLPLAPRCRSSRIIHAEKQIIVALDEDGGCQIRDGFLEWRLADVARQSQDDAFT